VCPKTYSGLVIDSLAGFGHALAVGLHIALLEVVGELVEILVVWEESMSLSTWEQQVSRGTWYR